MTEFAGRRPLPRWKPILIIFFLLLISSIIFYYFGSYWSYRGIWIISVFAFLFAFAIFEKYFPYFAWPLIFAKNKKVRSAGFRLARNWLSSPMLLSPMGANYPIISRISPGHSGFYVLLKLSTRKSSQDWKKYKDALIADFNNEYLSSEFRAHPDSDKSPSLGRMKIFIKEGQK